MKLIIAAVAAAVTLAATPAMAGKAELDLATKSGCLQCHTVDTKLVGPAYVEVAKKYKPADEAKLIKKVKEGGTGVWGPIPMPANTKVSDADIKILVKWILGGAK